MNLKQFFTINGGMFVPFGLVMLFVPTTFFSILDVDLDMDGAMMASMVGSMLLSFGLICWFARNEKVDSKSLRAVLIGNMTFHFIDSFLTCKAALIGGMNQIGFGFSAMHFVLAITFAYYLKNRKLE